MKLAIYEKYKLEQIERSEHEDSLLIFANELVRLKDNKNINLFWDCNEETWMREYIEESKRISKN